MLGISLWRCFRLWALKWTSFGWRFGQSGFTEHIHKNAVGGFALAAVQTTPHKRHRAAIKIQVLFAPGPQLLGYAGQGSVSMLMKVIRCKSFARFANTGRNPCVAGIVLTGWSGGFSAVLRGACRHVDAKGLQSCSSNPNEQVGLALCLFAPPLKHRPHLLWLGSNVVRSQLTRGMRIELNL